MSYSCFVCVTPFQIMTSINMVRKWNIDADLYVVPQFRGADGLADRVRELGIYRNVIYVDTDDIEAYKKRKVKLSKYMGIVSNYRKVEDIVPSFHLPGVKYDTIYISSKANIGRLMRLYYIKKGYDFETVYFEDGESSYDNAGIVRPSGADSFFLKKIFGSEALKFDSDMYLYSPDLYRELNPGSSVRVKPLPLIDQDEETRRIYNRVFGYTEGDGITEDVIILDILKDENLMPGEGAKLAEAYDILIDRYGADNVIIKRHPRDKSDLKPGYKYYGNYTLPFELILMNMDMRDKVLITASSTAVTLPKLLFGIEPTVIYLGSMIDTKQKQKGDVVSYYSACRKMYSDPERFIIPGSMNDLKSV